MMYQMTTRTASVVLGVACALAGFAGGSARADSILTIPGYRAPGTPAKYDRVQVRRFGSARAPHVLVLVPGTLGGAGDFNLVGPYLAKHVRGLQVWAEMRREGALVDNSLLLRGLAGTATPTQVFDYYVGWLADRSITTHYQPLDPKHFGFVKQWGLRVAMEDLHRVVDKARDGGRRKVVLGGHSLGGAEAAIYAVWDFSGRAGYKDIAGIVGIDGGPRAGATQTVAQVKQQLAQMQTKGPWLDLFGFGLPWITGPLAEVGALGVLREPDAPSIGQQFPLLPAFLKPSVPVTNKAQFGFAFDQSTSPRLLRLIQVHSGHVAATGNPHGWVDTGITPIENVARAFAREPLGAVDWYYPMRLTIDVSTGAGLRGTAAARFLGLRLKHEHQVDVPYYVIQTALGGTGNALAKGARLFKRDSRIPSLELVDRKKTYSHLDPLLASPSRNDFLKTVVPWLRRVLR
jgi:pimeloyl-ACP methyl ester carboxylesterase